MRGAEQGAAGICVDYVASRPREGNSVFSAFFPPFAGARPPAGGRFGGLLAVAVAVLQELARQSCCQYEQDTIVSTQWEALL